MSDQAAGRKWWVLVSIGCATFMSGLDTSIVNTVLPVIAASLSENAAAVEWVVTVYLLVLSGMLLGFGHLGDLRGHRNVFQAGFLVFMVSSGLCGLASGVLWLIGARVLQALGAAMMYANSPAILVSTFPGTERGRALGFQVMMSYLGLSLGPLLGGVLAVHFGWQAIFFVNVPVAALGIYLSFRFIPPDGRNASSHRFDWGGAALFFLGLFGLLLVLNRGHAWGWTSARTVIAFAVTIAALAAFTAVELRHSHPSLDFSLFARPTFTGSLLTGMMGYVALPAALYVVPFYLMVSRRLDPEQAGIALTPLPLLMMLAAPISGSISDRVGTRAPTVLGLLAMTAGSLLLSRASSATPVWQIAVSLAAFGLGFGTFIAPNNSRTLGAAPRGALGTASAVLATARNVGLLLGVALSGAVSANQAARRGTQAQFADLSGPLSVAAAIVAVAMITSLLQAEPTPEAAIGRAQNR